LREGEDTAARAFDGQLGGTSNLDIASKFVTVSRLGNTITAQVDYTGTYKTSIIQMFGVNTIQIQGRGLIIVGMVDNPPSSKVIEELWQDPNVVPVPGPVTDPNYRDWKLQDGQPSLLPTDDSRAGNFGMLIGDGRNGGLAKKLYLPAGVYELRYWYKSAVIFPEYQPAYFCHPREQAVSWANSDKFREYNSSTIKTGGSFSSRVTVYLHPVKEDPQLALAPPLAGQFINKIDICTYAGRWVERSIKFEVLAPGYFWLAFVSEAPAGSVKRGGWIGKVKVCIVDCGDYSPNTFPYAFEDVIFRDSFDTKTVPNRSNFDFQSGEFPQAKYEVLPSTQWKVRPVAGANPVVPPETFQLSTEAPVWGGQHLLVNGFGRLTRRMLLSPGRYVLRYVTRAVGDARMCPLSIPDVAVGGVMLCNPASVGAVWRSYSICVLVYSSNFTNLGGDFPVASGSAVRIDDLSVAAGYPNYRYRLQQLPPWCTQMLEVYSDYDQFATIAITLDRVKVTPPLWL
jgi:hypothetical protein